MSDRELVRLLREEFSISSEELDLAIRHAHRLKGSIHMVLWQFGIISLEQLDVLIGRMVAGEGPSSGTPMLSA